MSSIYPRNEPLPVTGHVGLAVGDMVLVWGGYTTYGYYENGIMFQTDPYIDPEFVWIYDPECVKWLPVRTTGDIPLGTSGAGAEIIDNHMYVFGGHNRVGNTSDLYSLNLRSMEWQYIECKAAEQPSPRDKFMHWSYQDKFYIFGGFGQGTRGYLDDNGTFLLDDEELARNPSMRGWNSQLCIYNTTSGEWTNPKCSGSVPCARAAGNAARIGHSVYLFGGRHGTQRLNDLYELDLRTLHWTRLQVDGISPCGRSWHSFTAISESHIVLYGGYTQHQVTLDDLWLLDVTQGQWTPLQRDGLACRLWHTACLTDSKDLVIYGGCSNDINNIDAMCHNDVSVYRFTPHSLVRLCLDASHKHRHLLGKDIDSLPSVLQTRLQKRIPDSPSNEQDEGGQARTCSLS